MKRNPFANTKGGEWNWESSGRNEWDRGEAKAICQHKKWGGELELRLQKLMGSR